MRLTPHRLTGLCLLPLWLFLASGCAREAVNSPPRADLQAILEPKPVPRDEITTDPVAEAHYNASVEAVLDRVHSAALRLCRFYEATGVNVGCGN